MYIVSGGTKELVHVQLSSAAKSSSTSQAVLHSTGVTLRPFMVAAVADVVLVVMESSDEVRCLSVLTSCCATLFGTPSHAFAQHRIKALSFAHHAFSRQVQLFARDPSTGELSFSVALNIGTYTSSVQGNIMSFLVSGTNRVVALGMSNGELGSNGGLVVLDIEVR